MDHQGWSLDLTQPLRHVVSHGTQPKSVGAARGNQPPIFLGIRLRGHADGVAVDRRGQWLYYHALTARTLYRVPVGALTDATLDEAGRPPTASACRTRP